MRLDIEMERTRAEEWARRRRGNREQKVDVVLGHSEGGLAQGEPSLGIAQQGHNGRRAGGLDVGLEIVLRKGGRNGTKEARHHTRTRDEGGMDDVAFVEALQKRAVVRDYGDGKQALLLVVGKELGVLNEFRDDGEIDLQNLGQSFGEG